MIFIPENLQVLDFYSKLFEEVKFSFFVTELAITHLMNSVLLCMFFETRIRLAQAGLRFTR